MPARGMYPYSNAGGAAPSLPAGSLTLNVDAAMPLRITVERVCTSQAPLSELEAHLARGIAADDDHTGGTPLMIAARYGRVDCLELLLSSGATPNFEGRTEVNLTNRGAAAAMDRWMNGAVSPLYISAEQGHAHCVSTLLLAGADANFINTKDGSTPLSASCANGHVDCAMRLISAGAKMDTELTDGSTALHVSCRGGFFECAQLLVDRGCDVDAIDHDGQTPLIVAVARVQQLPAPQRAQAMLAMLAAASKGGGTKDDKRAPGAAEPGRVAELEARVRQLEAQLADQDALLTPRSRAQVR
jgi:hypothetical protein